MWTCAPAMFATASPAGPATALPLDDTFSSGSTLSGHTADSGHTWTITPAAWAEWSGDTDLAISGGYVVASGSDGECYSSLVLPTTYTIILDVDVTQANGLSQVGVYSQVDSGDGSALYWEFVQGSDGVTTANSNFHLLTGGQPIGNSGSYAGTGEAVDGAHTIRFEVSPGYALTKYDGTTKIVSSPPTRTGAIFDLFAVYSATPSVKISRVRVTSDAPSPNSGDNFVSDTFTGTNGTAIASHTPELGVGWFNGAQNGLSGHMEIQGNALVENSSSFSVAFSNQAPLNANYAVQADVTVADSAVDNFFSAQLWARVTNASASGVWIEGYFVEFAWALGTGWSIKLWKQDSSNTSTQLGSTYTPTSPTAHSTHTLRLELNGSSLTVKYDGSSVITATDSTYSAAGSVGVLVWGSTSELLDNYLAEYL